MLILEALRAQFGDSLLLHFGTEKTPRLAVIDGGPPGVYNDALEPRLLKIREERKLAAKKALEIDLMMVSHIDRDHIAGILELFQNLQSLKQSQQPVPWTIKRFWHNSFDDILDNDDLSVASAASVLSPAAIGGLLPHPGSLLLTSVPEGRDLRNLANFFKLGGNPPFKGLLRTSLKPVKLDNLKLTVVAPGTNELQALQKEWNEEVKKILETEKAEKAHAKAAAFIDRAVANLSSIVVLAEADGKKILLTGDGRGDHTLRGLEETGLVKKGGTIELDILKMPHHGSVRDVAPEYFERIRARHYVISADGKYENPDIATLEMISKARPDDGFTIHFTYAADQFNVKEIGKKVGAFFEKEKAAGRKYNVEARKPDDLSLRLKLA
jgi:ribonuclease BN (tRNA processing enzyme)